MLWPDGHHEHAFAHMCCAAPKGAQQSLVAADPNRYLTPPYVGMGMDRRPARPSDLEGRTGRPVRGSLLRGGPEAAPGCCALRRARPAEGTLRGRQQATGPQHAGHRRSRPRRTSCGRRRASVEGGRRLRRRVRPNRPGRPQEGDRRLPAPTGGPTSTALGGGVRVVWTPRRPAATASWCASRTAQARPSLLK